MRTGEKVIRQIEDPTPYNPNAPDAQFLYAGFIGVKYWLRPKIGVYSELGSAVSILSAGISVRL